MLTFTKAALPLAFSNMMFFRNDRTGGQPTTCALNFHLVRVVTNKNKKRRQLEMRELLVYTYMIKGENLEGKYCDMNKLA